MPSTGPGSSCGSSSNESPAPSISPQRGRDDVPSYYMQAHSSPGPSAVMYRIESLFGTHAERQSKLDKLHGAPIEAVHPHLQKEASKLAGYLQPCYPILSQLSALRSIMLLTTRYIGLRKIFYSDPILQSLANSPELLTAAWARSSAGGVGLGWQFYLKLAVFCLAESPLSAVMERQPPSSIACLSDSSVGGSEVWESSVVEMLLHHSKAGPAFGVGRISAIRYLDGLLQLPAFWHSSDKRRLTDVLGQLCNAIAYMIHDADFYPHDNWLSPSEPVDDFAHTLFVGIAGAVHRFLFCPPGLASILNLFLQAKFSPSYPKSANFAPIVKHLIIDYFGSSAGASQSIEYPVQPQPTNANIEQQHPHPQRPVNFQHHRTPTADSAIGMTTGHPSPQIIYTSQAASLQPVRFTPTPTSTTFTKTPGGPPKSRKLVKRSRIRWPSV